MNKLQSQFGDMDLTFLQNAEEEKKDRDSDDESSYTDPPAGELESWQQAQFQKGQKSLEIKKLLQMTPLERRRKTASATPSSEEEEEWEQVAALPDLDSESGFFPSADFSGNELLGVHPLLQRLTEQGDPEILGTKWVNLFKSSQQGLSFANLVHTLRDYNGPTVMLIGCAPSASKSLGSNTGSKSATIGFYTTSGWTESAQYFGGGDGFLFRMDDETGVEIFKKKDSAHNKFMYCHPSTLNVTNRHSKTTAAASTNGVLHGIGIGGNASAPRLHLTETLEECRALDFCETFEAGNLVDFSDSLYYFDVVQFEVWGCGGSEWIAESLKNQLERRSQKEAMAKRARTVHKKHFMQDLQLLATHKPTNNAGMFDHVQHTSNRCDL